RGVPLHPCVYPGAHARPRGRGRHRAVVTCGGSPMDELIAPTSAALVVVACSLALPGCGAEIGAADAGSLRRSFRAHAEAALHGPEPLPSAGGGFLLRPGVAGAFRAARIEAELPADGSGAILLTAPGGFSVAAHEVGASGRALRVEQAVAYRRAGGTS